MKSRLITLLLVCAALRSLAQAPNDSLAQTKERFVQTKAGLENMLDGKASLSYERAIFLIENAWWDGRLDYKAYGQALDSHTRLIETMANIAYRKPRLDSLSLYQRTYLIPAERMKLYRTTLSNWAIFNYITDTTIFYAVNAPSGSITDVTAYYHLPYLYSFNDPMGSTDWTHTQVSTLLNEGKGNCFALASLFKIFSDRLQSKAWLCTAPGHIYIRHNDIEGRPYNIELSNGGSFPGSGTIEALTHTSREAMMNNIAIRDLNDRQAVALCLIYLAKGYEHKTGIKSDDFMLACAEKALSYDSLSLNAMLLKEEMLEERIAAKGKEVKALQADPEFMAYQDWVRHVYSLGYREMPVEMKNLLVKGWMKDSTTYIFAKNYVARKEYGTQKETRKASLSWGVFDEEIHTLPVESYGRALFDTRTKKITGFTRKVSTYNDYNFDPVAFAWSVDPMAHKFPMWGPYTAFGDNPIRNIDPNGDEFFIADKAQQTTALGYFKEQFKTDIFAFNKNGDLKLDKAAYKEARGDFNENQKSMAESLIKVIKSSRVLEARLYDKDEINFKRNPVVADVTEKYDPDLKRKVQEINYRTLSTGKGVSIPKLGQEALTTAIVGDDRAFVLFNTNAAATGTFEAKDGKRTNPCASCLFIHEILDHGSGYMETGVVPGNTPQNIENHNKALENVGSPTRTGADHTGP